MSTPFAALTPFTARVVDIHYVAAVWDCEDSDTSDGGGVIPPIEFDQYLQPDGVSLYLQPDGESLYLVA